MKIKEILPFTIESPVIHLVQPSPTIPLGHEVVFQQSSSNGSTVNAIYALAAQEKRVRRQRKIQQESKRFKDEEESNLSCGFISPPIHQATEEKKKVKASFYDLRNNNRSMSIAVESPVSKLNPTLSARSKSLDDSPKQERRKNSPDFEDILRDLGSSRTSDAGESTTSKASSGESDTAKPDVTRKCSVTSSDSVFYDISLDDPNMESSNTSPPVEFVPRKSFSEETFDRNHTGVHRNRNRILETMRKNWRTISSDSCDESYEEAWNSLKPQDKRRVSQMVDDLLVEIYGDKGTRPVRRRSCTGIYRGRSPVLEDSHYDSLFEDNTGCTEYTSASEGFRLAYLQQKRVVELASMARSLQADVKRLGGRLVKQLVRRDCLLAKQDYHCNWITAYLQANSEKRSEDTKTRFSVAPAPGDSGFTQWQNGMRMVARLPEGIPSQFRKTLWLNLAEKHLASRGVQWAQVEEFCFNEFTNPDDEELGVQIVKDVHRTGCSLFCGVSGKDNQALLKRVLLAYARWNKAVGYCQGFNMLAALILQVMDKSEVDSVKVMIFLIEGVLPESYFANNLRGLSVDMAVFRDLLRIKLPTLSRHFDQLQCDSKDSGTSYEPPLTNVFTMQWFLTLFCNCLPQDTVLRVWDLIFLEGNHILLSTALAIWSTLSDRIMTVESADEFYSIMGVLTREMLEFGLMDANALIKAIVGFTLPELPDLREKYLYNITPWTQSVSTVARRGLRLFYSDDDTDTEEDDEKIAIATAYGLFRSPKRKDGASGVTSPPRALSCPDKEKIAMDISALTKQYRKLRERQKQAHVILTAACGSQSLVGPTSSHVTMNHLLMGKFALVNNKGRRLGPPPGSIPPPSQPRPRQGEKQTITISGETLHWKDTTEGKKVQQRDNSDEEHSPPEPGSRRSSSSSTSTELCDDPQRSPSDSDDLSDASALLPSDTESSTPKRPVQPKVQHPSDVISCKEEDEEAFEKNEEEKHTCQAVLEVKQNESNKSCRSLSPVSMKSSSPVSPDGDVDKPQKRKLSFRIDPEELRQLDRKLSLKIVEIERRKSSAGIESDDLNSKVLFPFDRDYIQELEKCDRDTPTSIPDDRMCSSEDYLSGFGEETILIPDIITTHKPLGYRMASVEECDETKVNDSCCEPDGSAEVDLMPENISDDRAYMDNESSEELYDGEEEEDDEEEGSQTAYQSYNFDELFINKDTEINKDCFEQRGVMDVVGCSGETSNDCEYSLKPHQNGQQITSTITTTIKTNQSEEISCSSLILTEESRNMLTSQEYDISNTLFQRSLYLSDDMKANKIVTETVRDDSFDTEVLNSENFGSLRNNTQNIEVSRITIHDQHETFSSQENSVNDTFELTAHGISNAISPNLSDSEKALERKLAHVLPKLSSLSFDSSMPDVAAVASREARINSIREKYAKLGQTSKDEGESEEPKCLILLKSTPKTEQETIQLTEKLVPDLKNDETKREEPEAIVSLIEGTKSFQSIFETSQESVSKTNVSYHSIEIQSSICKTSSTDRTTEEMMLQCMSKTNLTDDATNIQSKLDSDQESVLSAKDNLITETKEKSKHKEEEEEINQAVSNYDEEIKRPSSVSSNRRGSEVALSLILKENSQILSKIQQQSRRNSEINIEETFSHERLFKSELPKKDTENKLKTDKEILLLTKAILNIEVDSNKSCQADEKPPELCNEFSLTKYRLASEDLEHNFCEKQLIFSDEVLLNKNKSESCIIEKTETDGIPVVKGVFEKQEITKNSNIDEKHDPLPDVCRFDSDSSKSPKHKNTIISSDKFQPYTTSILNSNTIETHTCTNTSKIFKDPYIFSKRPSIMSPTTEVDENSPPEVDTKLKSSINSEPIVSLYKSTDEQLAYSKISTLHNSDCLKVDRKDTEIDGLSDTNEDIIKELRALNIKPEEVLEYTDSQVIPITPATPEDSLLIQRQKSPVKDVLQFSTQNDEKYDFENFSADPSYEFRTSRHRFHAGHKTSSFDISSTKTDLYPEERHRPFVRAATTDNDDLLYLNSYKSHGRLLIEKGELDTFKNLENDEVDTMQRKRWCDRKSDDESAYDYRGVSSSRVNRSYSEFLSDDTRSSSYTKTEPREKTLFKYKSEDYGRSASPPHYRFSSASPVRKRLDTLLTDSPTSPYSSLARAKSPSPSFYGSSHSLSSRESCLIRSPERIGTDRSYEPSACSKRYSRTESLDLSSVEVRSSYLKKRAESLDVSTSDKLQGDKKSPSSPQKFNPFPVRSSSRQPKELGVKLGLYLPQKSDKSPSKHLT